MKNNSAAKSHHYAAVAGLGCVICGAPAEVHHYKGLGGEFPGITIKGSCMGKKAPYWETFPLCPIHHTHGGVSVAIHAGILSWEAAHGRRQWEFVKQAQEGIGWKAKN